MTDDVRTTRNYINSYNTEYGTRIWDPNKNGLYLSIRMPPPKTVIGTEPGRIWGVIEGGNKLRPLADRCELLGGQSERAKYDFANMGGADERH